MAILAMIFPILFFLPLVAGDKTEYDKYYANQSLLLLLLGVAVSIVGSLLTRITSWFAIVSWLLSVFELVLWIIGIVNASKGTTKPLPVIGGIQIIK